MDDIAAAPQAGQAIARLLDRAILTAHLLTGNLQLAEAAALAAIHSWNPGEEPGEVLLQNVWEAAARAPVEPSPHPHSSDSYLPHELKAVLRLPPQLRRCFVLRILAGLPAKVCARLLSLHSGMVDRYTRDALRRLALERDH